MSETNDNKLKLSAFFGEEYDKLKYYVNSKISKSADRDAEDIIQDVALKLFSGADDYSPINNIAGFVYSAIRNKIIDTMRTKKPKSHFQDIGEGNLIEFIELFHNNSDNSYPEKMKHALIKTISELKPHYREIIIAIDFEGLSYREISSATGIPEGTLMSRRHRALSILNKKLKNELYT